MKKCNGNKKPLKLPAILKLESVCVQAKQLLLSTLQRTESFSFANEVVISLFKRSYNTVRKRTLLCSPVDLTLVQKLN